MSDFLTILREAPQFIQTFLREAPTFFEARALWTIPTTGTIPNGNLSRPLNSHHQVGTIVSLVYPVVTARDICKHKTDQRWVEKTVFDFPNCLERPPNVKTVLYHKIHTF